MVRTYGGLSARERTEQRKAQLLEAGLDVLADGGLSRMTMTAVCVSAGLTERYFYESFRNLDDLLFAIAESITTELADAMLAALDAAPPRLYDRCRAPAVVLFDLFADDPRKGRLYIEAAGHPTLQPLREASLRAFAELLAEQMREFGDLADPQYQPRLVFLTTMLVGGLAEAIPRWLSGEITLDPDELVDEGARLCVAAADILKSGTETA